MIAGHYFADLGIIAGCSFAATFVRIYMMSALDKLELPAAVQLDQHIDDSGISCVGTAKAVVQ